jgi:hypothetical protein
MRKLITCLYLLLVLINVSAKQISKTQALEKALLFGKKATSTRLMSNAPANSSISVAYIAKEEKSDSLICFYVFNRGVNDGYIIVSAEDNATEILGYCDQGSFDYSTLPDNMKGWLEGYREEITYIRAHSNLASEGLVANSVNSASPTTIAPLLGNIKWDQGAPYNSLCPLYLPNTYCATGCAATAMAQIMYFHKWPNTGVSSHSYSPYIQYGNALSANFAETTYRWNDMTPTYNEESTEAAKNAVATLMLHCGIAIDMDYGAASGALSKKWCYALTNYFNYDKGLGYKNRDNYGAEEWEGIIRNELINSRPVYVTGFSSNGGHAFVCDGYDSQGFFHINWGWSGMSNGYFRTTALTPATQGIGGSDGGFNYRQSILIGIQRPLENSKKDIELISSESLKATPATIAKTDLTTIKLSGKVQNMGWEDLVCDLGIAAYDGAGNQVFELEGASNISIADSATVYGPTLSNVNFSTLSDGVYTLRPMCRVSGITEWSMIHSFQTGYSNYLIMNIENNTIKFSSPKYYTLSASEIKTDAKVYSSTFTSVSAKIKNSGGTEYYGDVKTALYSKETKKKIVEGGKHSVNLIPGDSTIVTFEDKFNVPAGEYLLAVIDADYLKLNSYIPITILEAPVGKSIVTATGQISFPDNNKVLYSDMQLSAELTSSQGVYSGYVYPYILTEDGATVLGCLNPKLVTIEPNSVVNVTFNGYFETGTPNGKYLIYLADGNNNVYVTPKEKAQCFFTLYNPTTGVDNILATDQDDCKVFPNPAMSVINIQTSFPLQQISIYGLNGSILLKKRGNATTNETVDVSSLPAGHYSVILYGEKKKVSKIIIKK